MRLPDARVIVVAGYLIAYVALDWASYIHPVAPYAITPWNPAAGLSLALLLVFGVRYAPAVFFAAVLAEVVVRGGGSSALEIATYGAILAAGYAGMGAFLLRAARFDPGLKSLRDLAVFGITAGVGAMGVAVCYVGAHVLAGAFTSEQFPEYALRDWIGEVLGIMILTPALLIHGPALVEERRWRLGGTGALQALSIVAALWVVFTAHVADPAQLFYLLFLPLIWISVRHGLKGATLALVSTQVGLIISVQLAGYDAHVVEEFQLLMLALGVTGAFLGMAVDQLRRTQDALRTSEAELSAVVSMAPDAILTIDEAGRVIAANAAAEALFRAPSGGLRGAALAALIPDLQEPIDLAPGQEVRARRLDATTFVAEVSLGRLSIGERRIHIGILRDTTQRKEIENRLRERERELDRAMRAAAAAEMASSLAHELNQPLTAAANFAQACDLMLKRHDIEPGRLAHTMERVVAEVSRAGEVVRRLRDLSRGGSARFESATLESLIEASMQTLKDRFQRHGIAVAVKLPADGLPRALVDRVQVEMVLNNLVANAVDAIASSDGAARDISIEAALHDPGFVLVAVRDSGPGLAPAIMERLFVPFSTTKPSGSGLGLSISRSIVESHGGRLWMEPQACGAAFFLTLPAAPGQERPA